MSTEENTANAVEADGRWHPEEWKNGKFLLVRYIAQPSGSFGEGDVPLTVTKRELLCTSKFGAEAIIFESEETAIAEAERLNDAAEGEGRDEASSENEEPQT